MLDLSLRTCAGLLPTARAFHSESARPSLRLRVAFVTLALVLTAWLLAACDSAPRDVYRTRGLVRAVDGEGDALRVAIHHEAIASFRDRERKTAPMPSMPMLFALQHGVAADGLAAGEKLAFTFEVRWDERPTLVITELARLPETTALTLSHEH